MVRAWYMDNDHGDQRNEHHRNPPEFVDLKKLFEVTGVEYFQVNVFLIVHCEYLFGTNFKIIFGFNENLKHVTDCSHQ